MREINRREFVKSLVALGATALGAGGLLAQAACSPSPGKAGEPRKPSLEPAADQAYLAVARGGSPAEITKRAVAALGGIERFVHAGDDVIIKPNICVAYHTYEYAATTNPEVVATLVSLCLGAGAKRVRVMDFPFGGTAEDAYVRSGIQEAVTAAGGLMELMADMKYKKMLIPDGRDLKECTVYQDVLGADAFINVPIAKHHSLGRLSLGMKNLLGVVLQRSKYHVNLGQRVADLTSLVYPTLTVVDAVRILTAHGPTGGSLNDVKQMDTVIASHDPVAADSYAATFFDLAGADIAYVKAAAEMGLGEIDLSSLKVEEIQV